ncbi:MAG: GTPase family protein [Oceanisphaera sp.]|uniref:GTPase family protein n=1 Tax=Oceanisphaera sp. TaxID=1929979 RepID=UPI003F9D55D2
MDKIKKTTRFLNNHINRLLSLSVLGFILPLLLLSGFGLYAIVTQGYTLYFVLILLLSSLLVAIPRWILHKNHNQQTAYIEDESLVDPSPDWSQAERRIWEELNASISQKLQQNSEWLALKDHGLALALEVAQAYGKQELDFTVPEGLTMLEEISRRYRTVLNEHIPAIDKISISQAKRLYDFHDKYGTAAKETYKYGMLAWRALRMTNPIAGLASEIRGKLLGSMSDQALASVQSNAKRALLQEVVKVGIDLYSGRFVIEQSQVGNSKVHQQDETRLAIPTEPVRVCLVGQVSVGKSSLINALLKNMSAEQDALPSTHTVGVYPCIIEGEEPLRLIDMAGLDGSDRALENAFKEITQSDLVLWVLKANQPSRQLDIALQQRLDAFYADKKNISRKKPQIIGVLNQVDKLKPIHLWAPPYDLCDLTNTKVKNINDALAFNCSTLGLDNIYPLALAEDKPSWGLDSLEAEIQAQYEHAIQVQLNRRRTDSQLAAGFKGQTKRLFKASKTVATLGLYKNS